MSTNHRHEDTDMRVVHFKAQDNAATEEQGRHITFESRAETEAEALRQGRDWAKANGWIGVEAFLFDEHRPLSICEVKRHRFDGRRYVEAR